jgi:transcriptional regulator GlxA family with amidase domain
MCLQMNFESHRSLFRYPKWHSDSYRSLFRNQNNQGKLSRTKGVSSIVDGKVITSEGPGSALEFGLILVRELFGDEKAQTIADQMRFQGKL